MMTRLPLISHAARICFAAALALGAVACGGEDRGRPEPSAGTVEPVNYCELATSYELQPVVEFDAGARSDCSSVVEVDMRGGPCAFYYNYDLANSLSTDTPEPDLERCTRTRGPEAFAQLSPELGATMVGEAVPEPRCGEAEAAFHVRGQNIAMCFGELTGRMGWGGAAEVVFTNPLDASEWDGVAFWIRRGNPATESSILFTLSDTFTFSVLGQEDAYCSAAEVAADSSKCDAFGVAVTLKDEWAFIAVPFSALRQKGFGVPSPNAGVDASALKRIQVQFTAGDWDFWIDDLSFFRRR